MKKFILIAAITVTLLASCKGPKYYQVQVKSELSGETTWLTNNTDGNITYTKYAVGDTVSNGNIGPCVVVQVIEFN